MIELKSLDIFILFLFTYVSDKQLCHLNLKKLFFQHFQHNDRIVGQWLEYSIMYNGPFKKMFKCPLENNI